MLAGWQSPTRSSACAAGGATRSCRCPVGCPSCSAEGCPVQRRAGVRADVVAQAGQALRARPVPLRRPAADPARPAGHAGGGRHAAGGDGGAGTAARPAPAAAQGRAPQPHRQLARPLRGPGRVPGRGHDDDDRHAPETRRCAMSMVGLRRPRRPAVGEPGRAGRRRPQPRRDRGRRRPRGRRRVARGALAAAWPTPSARWGGGRSRTARPRRSAATRWRSRATARSPTRSPSSCAGRRPIWWWCPRRSATASRASGAGSGTWSPGR